MVSLDLSAVAAEISNRRLWKFDGDCKLPLEVYV